MKMATSVIQRSASTPHDGYSTDGLTAGTGVTIDAGGYVKFGNIVIVNLRLVCSSKNNGDTLVSGLPTCPSVRNAVSCTSNNQSYAYYITNAGLLCPSQNISSGTYLLNAVYISD